MAQDKSYEWKIAFEDDFNTFDNAKWRTLHDNGNRTIWSNKELQWYSDGNVAAEDGILKLIVKKESVFGKDIESQKQFDYTSGMICNSKSYTQQYGKWEMKCGFPFKKGFWPAFYLVPLERPTLPEIDIFEYFGIDENKISCSHHWGIDYGLEPPMYNVRVKEIEGDFSNQWMVWSLECTPEELVWKLNDKVVYRSTQGLPCSPLYMIANVAVKDRKENDFQVDDTGLPYVMEIDYVRIYQMVPKN